MSHTGLRVVNFEGPSVGTFPQAASITIPSGPGVVPKGAIFFAISTTGLSNQISQTARISVGFADESVDERCVMSFGESGAAAASADAGHRIDNTTVIQVSNLTNVNLLAEANVTAFVTDGCTLSWSALANVHGQAIFFYGDGVESSIHEFTGSATEDASASISGLSYAPDVVFVCSIDQAFAADTQGTDAMLSFGTAARTSNTQSCSCTVWEHQESPTSSGSIARDDSCAVRLTSAAGTVTEGARLEVTSWNNDGVTFTTRNESYALRCMVLCLKLPDTSAWAGAPTMPASGTGAFSRTDPDFKPQALFFYPVIVGALDTVAANRGSIGLSATDAQATGCVDAAFRDNQVTSDSGVHWSTTRLLSLINIPGTSNFDWHATWTSFDDRGWTGNVGDAAAADRPTAYLAISEVYLIDSSDTVGITDTVVMLANPVLDLSDTVGIENFCVIPAEGVMMTIVLSDDVGISEACAMTVTMVLEDTEGIEDILIQNGSALVVLSDAEGITDEFGNALLGNLIVPSDTMGITDFVVLADVIPTRAIARGQFEQGGAEAGAILSPGCERGEVQ